MHCYFKRQIKVKEFKMSTRENNQKDYYQFDLRNLRTCISPRIHLLTPKV